MRWLILGLLALSLLAGCGKRDIYRDEAFQGETPFSARIQAPVERVRTAVRHALLSQGYLLAAAPQPDMLLGSKEFQDDEERNVVLYFQAAWQDNGDGSATVYATAIQQVNSLETAKQTAGINLPALGGISVPAGSTRFQTKISGETIQDKAFYRRFYRLVEEAAGVAK
ncbi:MAG: DUF2242 domain-containing protein [Sulfuricellaceae bacterium]